MVNVFMCTSVYPHANSTQHHTARHHTTRHHIETHPSHPTHPSPPPCLPTGCEFSKVGIVHNIMRFQSRNDGFSQYMPHTIAVTGCLDYMWNLVQVRFLQTGVFDWQPLGPWACVVKGQWVGGTPPLDWLGLNYYSRCVCFQKGVVGERGGVGMGVYGVWGWVHNRHLPMYIFMQMACPVYTHVLCHTPMYCLIHTCIVSYPHALYIHRVVGDWKLATTCNPGETMTDMEYALYPEGLIKVCGNQT